MKILLAPMEGVLDFHLRRIFARVGGIDSCVTEFIRVTDHVLPDKVFLRYCPELLANTSPCKTDENPGETLPIRIQLLGSDPASLALNAKRAAELGASGIDLNFGCPAKTVNRHRGGACLLDETALLFEIASAVRAAVPSAIPVSAKIRLGNLDREHFFDNACALAAAGMDQLVVHARTRADGYRPPAYWHWIGQLRQRTALPLIANGEIWTVDDYRRCRDEAATEDVMIGRGLLANPRLALAIKNQQTDTNPEKAPWREIAQLLHSFFLDTTSQYPSKFLGNRLKQWLHYLKVHYSEADALFNQIKSSRDYAFIDEAIRAHLR